jgi:hypothetical protein
MDPEMHNKLFVLTTGNIREAERAVSDWNNFVNVILDSKCSKKYLSKLSSACNLLLVGDIGEAIGALHEELRKRG